MTSPESRKVAQFNHNFIFDVLSAIVISFANRWLFLNIKNNVNLRKTRLFSKGRLLAHAQLCGNISRRKCPSYSLTL